MVQYWPVLKVMSRPSLERSA